MTKSLKSQTARRPREATALDKHLGERLRQRRIELKMSQTELGEMSGVTFQQVQKYERGANRIAASRLYEIARKLGVGMGYFFDTWEKSDRQGDTGGEGGAAALSAGAPHEAGAMDALIHSNDGLKLAAGLAQVEDKGVRRALLSLIRAIGEDDETDAE